jgi:hypothetical protein
MLLLSSYQLLVTTFWQRDKSAMCRDAALQKINISSAATVSKGKLGLSTWPPHLIKHKSAAVVAAGDDFLLAQSMLGGARGGGIDLGPSKLSETT